jgi:hypothetical protein
MLQGHANSHNAYRICLLADMTFHPRRLIVRPGEIGYLISMNAAIVQIGKFGSLGIGLCLRKTRSCPVRQVLDSVQHTARGV